VGREGGGNKLQDGDRSGRVPEHLLKLRGGPALQGLEGGNLFLDLAFGSKQYQDFDLFLQRNRQFTSARLAAHHFRYSAGPNCLD